MSTELFDIFDENNQPLGITKPRDIVHRDLIDWHRATHIWIVNEQGEFLCQQRSLAKDANPGKWQSFFGGHLKVGETYEKNALQELREEIGIRAQASDLILIRVGKSEQAKHHTNVYLIKWNDNLGDIAFNDGEVEKVEWMTLDTLQKRIEQGDFCNPVDMVVIKWMGDNFKI